MSSPRLQFGCGCRTDWTCPTHRSAGERALGKSDQARAVLAALPIMLRLPDDEALALAQFCKRICWSDMRGLAIDDDETYVMRSAIDKLQRALADFGFAPR